MAATSGARAQVPIPTLGTPVTESFDTLANTGGTHTALPTGWALVETGTNADQAYMASTGGGATGDTYSFGANNAADRALGSIAGNKLEATYGASFQNKSGATATALTITYFGEMWRHGNTADDVRVFEYSLDATSLTTGTWVAVTALDLHSQDIPCQAAGTCGATGEAKDGNNAAFRVQKSSVITGLSLANNATFWIRWSDTDSTGADDGLGVDDFSLTATAVAPTNPVVVVLKDVALVGGGTVLPGSVLTYNVLVGVDATSTQDIQNLVISDTLPAQVTAIINPADANFIFQLDNDGVVSNLTAAADGDAGEIVGDVLTVRVGHLAVNADAMLTFRATVDPSGVATTITNTATARFDGASSGTGLTATDSVSIDMRACANAAACNDNNPCTDDSCSALGSCVHTNNTAPCNDNNACTLTDACAGGTCVGTGVNTCSDTNPCTDDVCTPATGCSHPNNTAPCSDNNACTGSDVCAGGACVPGAVVSCDDNNVCTTDSCVAATGCAHDNNTLACDDGSLATFADTCAAGACAGTAVVCAATQCQIAGTPNGTADCPPTNAPSTTPCDDGDATTPFDFCDGAGNCVGSDGGCPPNNVCGTYEFDGVSCVLTPLEGPCDDGQATTRNDACQAGACVGTAYTCTAAQCEASSVPNGTDCTVVLKDAGTACDDGNLATRSDVCDAAGACAGTGYTCTPGACEATSTPDGSGCATTPLPSGTACDDGNPCTSDDQCDAAGACSGAALCDAGEVCDDAGGCTATHCLDCASDADCGLDSACLEVGPEPRCLLSCEADGDCASGQVCREHATGGLRCFDTEGVCAAPTTQPDENPEAVEEVEPGAEEIEPQPETVEPEPDEVEPTPEETEPSPEVGPETTEPSPEVVEPAPDVTDATDATDAHGDATDTSRTSRVEGGGGCAGGETGTGALAALALLGGYALRRRPARAAGQGR